MRLPSLFYALTFTSLFGAAACGDDGGSKAPTDAPPPPDVGFNKPTSPLKANYEMSDNNWVELGPANLSCLNTASSDMATTVQVTLATRVDDFQSGNKNPHTTVTVFPNQDQGSPVGQPVMSDDNGDVTVTIPTGTKRFGFKMVNTDNSLDTLLLNQIVAPDEMNQTLEHIQIVSTATAQTLPALIGVARTPGTGILAGAMRDCGDPARTGHTGPQEISNFVATVSSTDGTVAPLMGVDSYYFSSSAGLPVRHKQQEASSKDGLFMAIEMQPTPTAYVQIWGYLNDADMAADKLTLVAQLKTAVIADVVITGSYEPLRTP